MATICSPDIYVGSVKMLTLSRFKHFLMLCRTRVMKSQNFLSRNCQKNRLLLLSHKSTRVACLCKNERCNPLAKSLLVWRVDNNLISNKSLNNGTFSRFKRFLTPYKTRDMKIQNFSSRNRQKNRPFYSCWQSDLASDWQHGWS